jgi:organic hydroperoxide reductase OsmC/OhrA
MLRPHRYQLHVEWTGNRGEGTASYRGYDRNHRITTAGKPELVGSADPHFYGDKSAWNPEELLVAALSACHMMSYLHVCADAGIVVTAYSDDADGEMVLDADGGGQMTQVTLHPRVTISDERRREEAEALHHRAHQLCFIARSVNFPVTCAPVGQD